MLERLAKISLLLTILLGSSCTSESTEGLIYLCEVRKSGLRSEPVLLFDKENMKVGSFDVLFEGEQCEGTEAFCIAGGVVYLEPSQEMPSVYSLETPRGRVRVNQIFNDDGSSEISIALQGDFYFSRQLMTFSDSGKLSSMTAFTDGRETKSSKFLRC